MAQPSPSGMDTTFDQPAHWITRRNKGKGFTEGRERKQLSEKRMKKDEAESGEV